MPVLAVAIVLLGGATAAAIVLTKHEERSSETVTAAASEAGESGAGEYEESGYEYEEEPGSEYEEPGSEYEEEPESEYEEEPGSEYEEEEGSEYEEEEPGNEEAEEEHQAAEPAPSAAQVAQHQVQHALRAHFHRLAYGNYSGAFYDFSAREQRSAGGESAWVDAQREDGLESFNLDVETSLHGPHSAQATIVDFQTRSVATGCHRWSGYWDMSKVYGEWRISAAKLRKEPC